MTNEPPMGQTFFQDLVASPYTYGRRGLSYHCTDRHPGIILFEIQHQIVGRLFDFFAEEIGRELHDPFLSWRF